MPFMVLLCFFVSIVCTVLAVKYEWYDEGWFTRAAIVSLLAIVFFI